MIYTFKVWAVKNGPEFARKWHTEANNEKDAWEMIERALKRLETNHKTTFKADLMPF